MEVDRPIAEDESQAGARGELLRAYIDCFGGACPLCGYDLARLECDRCPECGEHLRLRIGLVEPRLGIWIFGLVSLAGSTGLWTMFSGIMIYSRIAYGPFGGWLKDFLATTGATTLSAIMLAGWVARRRWIMQRQRPVRRLLAAASWAFALLVIVAVIAFTSP